MHTTAILVALVGLIGLAIAGCSGTEGGPQRTTATCGGSTTTSGSAKFVHAVFFTLKENTPEAEIDSLIADADQLLAKIPSVRKIDSGRRDTRMDRDVNDKDFTVGLVVYFDDKEGHDVYSAHPLHQQYIEKHKAYWAGVKVFDFVAR